jgi:hypothetical protein
MAAREALCGLALAGGDGPEDRLVLVPDRRDRAGLATAPMMRRMCCQCIARVSAISGLPDSS